MSRILRRGSFAVAVIAALATTAANAQLADLALVNGKIVTLDTILPMAEAIAIRDNRILAVGTSQMITAMTDGRTRVINLAGRTVVPGLINAHIHAIRAGLTYAMQVQWTGAGSLEEAFARLRNAAGNAPKGSWLVVAGGWTESQFSERRLPTQAEIAAAAPEHHVYVQMAHGAVLLSPGGTEALGLAAHRELASRLKIETSQEGRPTGWLSGDSRAIDELFDLLPRPDFTQQLSSTRKFFRVLNSFGITGVLDPGAHTIPIDEYRAVFQLWRERGLTIRIGYHLCAPRPGHELQDFRTLTAALPMGLGDDWLRFNGIGENVTWGAYNNDNPTEAHRENLRELLRWAVPRGMGATFHWYNERSVHFLLDVLEEVNRETPIAGLRWSIAHLNDAPTESLGRIKALGMGWLVQNPSSHGAGDARVSPPIVSALKMGLPVGAGTDAHRVTNYNPFVSLQWMLDGKTVNGTATRGRVETPTRLEALRIYTLGSAWFAHDEGRRGSLSVGKFADMAVLNGDYLTVPVMEISKLASVLTIVGGRIVYSAEDYAGIKAE